jgi:hypothetical protein
MGTGPLLSLNALCPLRRLVLWSTLPILIVRPHERLTVCPTPTGMMAYLFVFRPLLTV